MAETENTRMKINYAVVGRNITRLRLARAMTQVDLAKRLNVKTANVISSYEKGDPCRNRLDQIAEALSVSVSDLTTPVPVPFVDTVEVGKRLAEARTRLNMTQKSVAKRVGMIQTSVCHLERGKFKSTDARSLRHIRKLAEAYFTKVECLLYGTTEEREDNMVFQSHMCDVNAVYA